MKKYFKKALLSVTLISTLGLSSNVIAAEKELSNEVQPAAIDLNGYEYIHSTAKTGVRISWEHEHMNPNNVTAAVTRSVSRELNASATVSATSSFKIMQQKVGFTAEVSLGTSKTTTTSITWNVPANSTYLLRFGSRYAQATGKENYWSNGSLIRTKSVSGNWTYRSYSDSIKQ